MAVMWWSLFTSITAHNHTQMMMCNDPNILQNNLCLNLLHMSKFSYNSQLLTKLIYYNTVKPLSIVFQGTGKFERYIREMIVPGNH
jgi:hypothetical protein